MRISLSIITICYNNLNELIETCKSIDNQTLLPEEHLIIDGSTEKEIIDWLENNPQSSYRKWIHERDKGISDAFNKGIKRSSGDIIHLLNSGDKYYDETVITEVRKHFEKDPELKWTHGLYVQNRGGIDVVTGASFSPDLLWKGMRTVAHPTMFVKRELYEKYGVYNEDFKIAMDYDFLVRIRNEKFYFIAKPLIYFAPGGASNTQFNKGLAEVRKSYETHIGSNSKLKLWQARQRLLQAAMNTHFGKLLFRIKNKSKVTLNPNQN